MCKFVVSRTRLQMQEQFALQQKLLGKPWFLTSPKTLLLRRWNIWPNIHIEIWHTLRAKIQQHSTTRTVSRSKLSCMSYIRNYRDALCSPMLPTNYGLLSSDLMYYVSWHTAISYENITNCVRFGYKHVACRDSRSFKASKMIK